MKVKLQNGSYRGHNAHCSTFDLGSCNNCFMLTFFQVAHDFVLLNFACEWPGAGDIFTLGNSVPKSLAVHNQSFSISSLAVSTDVEETICELESIGT